jgi:hypothetical protein
MQSQPIPSNVAGLSHHPRNRTRHAAGSATVLVIVVLVMLAMLGATYLQIARFERQSQSKQTGNIDAALDSVVALVKQRLKEDVVDKNDDLFNPDPAEKSISGEAESRVTGADEPYDYPWTNPAADSLVHREPGDMDDLVSTAEGGKYDDMWLASSSPDFSNSTNGVWPHITNLNGVFLSNNQDGALLGRSVEPQQEASVARGTGNPWYRDSNVPITTNDFDVNADNYGNGTLVDADGDGIGDSKWQWAPLDQVGNTRYVMAVRIVDLASMLNANVAMGLTDGGDFVGGDDAIVPRGTTPSEWDLTGFVNAFGGSNDPAKRLLDYRMGDGTSVPDNTISNHGERGGGLPARLPFWEKTGRYALTGLAAGSGGNTPSAGRHLTLGDEIELRFNNGLNRSATSIMEQEMAGASDPTFLHSNNDGRVHYRQWQSSSTVETFFNNEPRKWLTVASGAVPYTPPVESGDTDDEMKVELNATVDNSYETAVSDAIEQVYNAGNTSNMPGGIDNATAFADQLTANIIDYRDDDNKLTKVGERFGLEALPFISEVYVRAGYAITSTKTVGAASDNKEKYFVNAKGDVGYAIELRNPFKRTISLENIELQVDEDTVGGKDLAGLSGVPNELGPQESLILYRPTGNLGSGDDKSIEKQAKEADHDAQLDWEWPTLADPGGSASSGIDTEEITVGLRVRVLEPDEQNNNADSGSWEGYYSAAPSLKPSPEAESGTNPNIYSFTDDDTTSGDSWSEGNIDYVQQASLGNGNKWNVLTVPYGDFEKATPSNTPATKSQLTDSGSADPISGLNKLTERDKGNTNAPDEMTDLDGQQLLIADRGRIDHVGELAQIAVLGPDLSGANTSDDKTVGAMWEDTNGSDPSTVADFLLKFDPADAGSVAGGSPTDTNRNRNVPHAVMLMDQFTTLDVEDEFVPGKVNLNTAPRGLLEASLPVADEDARDRLVDAIINARQKPERNGDSLNPGDDGYRRGLAYVGETFWPLMDPDNNDAGNNGDSLPGHDEDGGNPKDTHTLNNVRVDFMPEDTTALSGSQDGIANDREEQLMLINWFHQMASTRSDVFAAWIVVHGYPAGDFTANDADEDNQGEPVESARLLVLLDRSNVGNDSDSDSVEKIDTLRIY